jgi:hypothetical protein
MREKRKDGLRSYGFVLDRNIFKVASLFQRNERGPLLKLDFRNGCVHDVGDDEFRDVQIDL